jgi:hypothetical protein
MARLRQIGCYFRLEFHSGVTIVSIGRLWLLPIIYKACGERGKFFVVLYVVPRSKRPVRMFFAPIFISRIVLLGD